MMTPPVGPQSTPPRVVISELMYHPVGEQTAQEEHEFVELHNPGTSAVNLSGWKLTGGIRLTFATGTQHRRRWLPGGGQAPGRPAGAAQLWSRRGAGGGRL